MPNEFGKQSYFERFFYGQRYTPAEEFEPRRWQNDCHFGYEQSCKNHRKKQSSGDSVGQHRYTIHAGPGSGKTKMAGLLTCHHLNRKISSLIVIVVPNRSIRRKTQSEFRSWFGIHLVTFHSRKYADGIPRGREGYILTYAHLIQSPEFHREITGSDTLVIFDEVHHLGDGEGWGDAASIAFSHVNHVICMTGTPWRTDNKTIPFVEYEQSPGSDLKLFRADGDSGFSYGMDLAIADEVCRKPIFFFRGGDGLTIKLQCGSHQGFKMVTFNDVNLNDRDSADRLRGAVRYGSIPRRELLRYALSECKAQDRKVIIFLGGDTNNDSTPTEDATQLLPAELRELGYDENDWEVVTGDDQQAQDKISRFGESDKWILISINMVSEGTDIPELSAAIFLTSVTAKQTTWQRFGRVLRKTPSLPPEALLFLFADPTYIEIGKEIIKGVDKILAEEGRIKKSEKPRNGDGDNGEHPNRREAIGTADDGLGVVVQFHGLSYSAEEWQNTKRRLKERGVPSSDFAVGLLLDSMRAMSDGNG